MAGGVRLDLVGRGDQPAGSSAERRGVPDLPRGQHAPPRRGEVPADDARERGAGDPLVDKTAPDVDSSPAFAGARAVYPFPIDVPPYRTTIDVSDLVTHDPVPYEDCFLNVRPCTTDTGAPDQRHQGRSTFPRRGLGEPECSGLVRLPRRGHPLRREHRRRHERRRPLLGQPTGVDRRGRPAAVLGRSRVRSRHRTRPRRPHVRWQRRESGRGSLAAEQRRRHRRSGNGPAREQSRSRPDGNRRRARPADIAAVPHPRLRGGRSADLLRPDVVLPPEPGWQPVVPRRAGKGPLDLDPQLAAGALLPRPRPERDRRERRPRERCAPRRSRQAVSGADSAGSGDRPVDRDPAVDHRGRARRRCAHAGRPVE